LFEKVVNATMGEIIRVHMDKEICKTNDTILKILEKKLLL